MGEFFAYKHKSQINHNICFCSKIFLFLFFAAIQLISILTKLFYFKMTGGILLWLGYWLLVIFSTGISSFALFVVLFLIIQKSTNLFVGITTSILTGASISLVFLYQST